MQPFFLPCQTPEAGSLGLRTGPIRYGRPRFGEEMTDAGSSFLLMNKNVVWWFAGPKRLLATILRPWEVIFGRASLPRNSPIGPYMHYLWWFWSSVSLSGLLWASLVVSVVPLKNSHSAPIPSASTLEGWVFWKSFVMWLGLCVCPWSFQVWWLLPWGWRLVRGSADECYSCQWGIWAVCQVLSMWGCALRAWAAFLSPVISIYFRTTWDSFYDGGSGLLWDRRYGMQNVSSKLFPEVEESNKQCFPGWGAGKFTF